MFASPRIFACWRFVFSGKNSKNAISEARFTDYLPKCRESAAEKRRFLFVIALKFIGVGSIILLGTIEFVKVMKLKSRRSKMIAPIVISGIMILYYVVYFGFLITLLDGIWKYVLGVIPLVLSAVMVKVCIERINEIKKGEEDDISKY